MIDDIKVADNIEDSFKLFNKLESSLDTIDKYMEKIECQLKEKGWEGNAHANCIYVQSGIKKYHGEIVKLCDELKTNVKTLKKDAENFADQSSNVKMIKAI